MQRVIKKLINSSLTRDGVGVRLRRALRPGVANIDPFLMLDEISFDSSEDYIGGFPSHPHRGFETVSYMLHGKMRHKDHLGNEGLIQDGAVQWMTAGRGVIHSEMPEQTQGVLRGFQLWINLPAKDKMQAAAYQEYAAEDFPVVKLVGEKGSVKVIAGTFVQDNHKTTGPVTNIATDANFYDIYLAAQNSVDFQTQKNHTVLLYCYEGAVDIAGQCLKQGQTAQLSAGEAVSLRALSKARLLYLSAEPIGEPVVSYGPFVMNTQAEIEQAIRDYQSGCFTE